ncbi:MBL fold metallo-hydrolase [Thermococcus sp.]|uniref:MBL fold metallo-hydrolase n=1 Tax=Thermococcus sp. TaxID=35749 RepID=UPI00345C1C45
MENLEVIYPDLFPVEIPPNTVMLKGLNWDSNVYLFRSGKEALVVDTGTGRNVERYFSLWLSEGYLTGLKKVVIFNTHEHFDHIGGNLRMKELFERLGVEVTFSAHRITAEVIERAESHIILDYAYGERLPGHEVELKLKDGDYIKIGKRKLLLIPTPGHTAGSSCLYLDGEVKLIFTGDTIFKGTVGRTDLPTGSREELRKSVERLAELDVDFGLPGHGWIIKDWPENIERVMRLL